MSRVILGADGQLGTALAELWPDAVCLGRAEFDLASPDAGLMKLDSIGPTHVVNCGAYTQVDRAEEEPELAWQINALGSRALAEYCQKNDSQLIHISTDFVFGLDSERTLPYSETDCPGPQGVYATTKLAGEHFVLAASKQHLVIRSCGLYGLGGKTNFVKTMLRVAQAGKPLKVVDDQICAPTSVKDLAVAIDALCQQKSRGLFHFTNQGQYSWYEFAKLIFSVANIEADLTPISTVDYGAPAKRPAYSILNCDRYQRETGNKIPEIESALRIYLAELPTVSLD